MIQHSEKVEEHLDMVNIVEEFKKHNINTIERVRFYDPKRKIWVFTKVAQDVNALDFKRKFIKKKTIKSKSQVLNSINNIAINKRKKEVVKVIKEKNKIDKQPKYTYKNSYELVKDANGNSVYVNSNSYCYLYFTMYTQGKPIEEIASICNKHKTNVHRELKYFNERWNLGLQFKPLKKKAYNNTKETIVNLMKQGITNPREISERTGYKYKTILAQKNSIYKLGLI